MAETITYGSNLNFIFGGDVRLNGTGTVPDLSVSEDSLTTACAIPRSALAQESLAVFVVPLTDFRVHDAVQTVLPNPSATDDLGLYSNTFGTTTISMQTYDVKAAGAQTLRARCHWSLPPEYQTGETVMIRLYAGMLTTIADTSCTIDVECHKLGTATAVGADLCSTAAQSMNSLTWANYDFTITPTALAAGDQFDMRISIAVNDAATGTAVYAAISKVSLLCDIKG